MYIAEGLHSAETLGHMTSCLENRGIVVLPEPPSSDEQVLIVESVGSYRGVDFIDTLPRAVVLPEASYENSGKLRSGNNRKWVDPELNKRRKKIADKSKRRNRGK